MYLLIYVTRNTGCINQKQINWLFWKDGKKQTGKIKEELTIQSVFFSTVLTFESMLKFYMLKIKNKINKAGGKRLKAYKQNQMKPNTFQMNNIPHQRRERKKENTNPSN